MHHIGYTSRALSSRSAEDLQTLCRKSQEHNCAIGVTGLLVYDGVRYIQVIEGDAVTVRRLMASIATDSRHDKIVYMIDGQITERAFESWGLACVGFNNSFSASQLLIEVKAKVDNVQDVNVMAAFIGFAALAK